jgi:predicted DNA-binding antitoxin AbrB/MazE fold protein
MGIEVEYQKGVLKPLRKIEAKEGKVFTIEIKPDIKEWKGVLKGLNLSSVELTHKIKEVWKDGYVSP